jgi:dihydrofolate reductase
MINFNKKRDVVLFIASSLDGYIAKPDGNVDWLYQDHDYGYKSFINSVDTVIMGRKTYSQVMEFGRFPYKDKTSYIFTNSAEKFSNNGVQFVSEKIPEFVKTLVNKAGKDVWLIGGSEIVSEFVNHDLIDKIILSVHPIILGKGIPLFSKLKSTTNLTLTKEESFKSGLVQLTYKVD